MKRKIKFKRLIAITLMLTTVMSMVPHSNVSAGTKPKSGISGNQKSLALINNYYPSNPGEAPAEKYSYSERHGNPYRQLRSCSAKPDLKILQANVLLRRR